jgi:hypothetical protein
MSLNDHERIDAGWPQSAPKLAPNQHGVAFDGPHPHRSYSTDANLDPTARLEWLDDLMFAAIDGDPVALDCAADAWKKTVGELGGSALEESRLQYMRHAQTVWHSLRGQPNHPPHKIFAAIEIISLLAHKTH